MTDNRVMVAVAQDAPVLFDKASAMKKMAKYAAEAKERGVKLLVFPEAFVPGYPRGLSMGARVGSRTEEGREDWSRYFSGSIDIPGADTAAMGEIARENELYIIVGAIEREREFSRSTLYNSVVYMGPDGRLLGKHRKLVPTGSERLLWGQGDGSTLTVVDTPFGRIGGLICWENYMPLARAAMYAKSVDIWVAPTADARDSWQATIRHIACEGRCFVISGNQYATKESYPADLAGYRDIEGDANPLCRGGSAVVGPLGDYIVPPLYDSAGLLVTELDLSQIAKSRFDFDAMGHYSRPDVFRLIVNETKQDNVTFYASPPLE